MLEGDPNRATHLHILSTVLSTRYETEGKLDDLNRAIECSQDVVKQIPKENSSRARRLIYLSQGFSTRYEKEKKLDALNGSIEPGQIAVNLTPKEDPDRAGSLRNLGKCLGMRYRKKRSSLTSITQSNKIKSLLA